MAARPRAAAGVGARGRVSRRRARRASRHGPGAEPAGDIIGDRRQPHGMVAGQFVDRGRADQPGPVQRARERRAALRGRPEGAGARAAGAGRADGPRRQDVAAGLARAVRRAAAGQRSRGVRAGGAAIRRAVRTLGAGVGGGTDDDRRAQGRRRRLHPGHGQAHRGERAAGRRPASGRSRRRCRTRGSTWPR